MTLKELKQWKCRAEKCVEIYKNNGKDTSTAKVTIPVNKFLDLTDTAIKALEQQPCEDCISRQAVINAINQNCIYENEYNLTASHIKEMVQQLPSVTPKEKIGYWYIRETYPLECESWECSECKEVVYEKTKYCPNCGARMVSE